MKTTRLLCLLVLASFMSLSPKLWSFPISPNAQVTPSVIYNLKKSMAQFGTIFAGLEVLRIKEKKPDWEVIDASLKELREELTTMQKADEFHAYSDYTDALSASLSSVQLMAQRRDKSIFRGISKMSETCFQCHTAHRPANFNLPDQKD